jgi:hypothetical protein
MKASSRIVLAVLFALIALCPYLLRAQDLPAAARIVLLFTADPQTFSSLLMDNGPFAKLTFPQDRVTVWPTPAGTRLFGIRAPGAQPKDVRLNLQSGKTYLVSLGLKDLPAGQRQDAPTKEITVTFAALDLPPADDKVRAFAYLAPSSKPLRAELITGASREAKAAPLELTPGKLLPLATGRFSLMVRGRPLLFLNSSTPGLYVYLLVPDAKGELAARSFVVFSNLGTRTEATVQPADRNGSGSL